MKITTLYSPLLLAAAMLAGCGDADYSVPGTATDDADVTLCIGIGVAVPAAPASSRANSLSYEKGIWHEDEISNALILIYDSPLNSSSGQIVKKIYVSGAELSEDDSYTEYASASAFDLKAYNAEGSSKFTANSSHKQVNRYTVTCGGDNLTNGSTYYIIAMANVGNIEGLTAGTSLATLRDFVSSQPLYTSDSNIQNYTAFAMTAVDEHKFVFSSSGSTFDVNAAIATAESCTTPESDLHVQRLAARIDVTFGSVSHDEDELYDEDVDFIYPDDDDKSYLIFPIYDANTNAKISGARFLLDNIEVCNLLNDTFGSYLIERNGSNTLFGSENWDTSTGYAQSTVKTPAKTKTFTTDLNYNAKSVSNTHLVDNSYAVLAYARENTFDSYNVANKYTSVKFTGRTNLLKGHFTGSGYDYDNTETLSYGNVAAEFNIRHCFPASSLDTSKPLAYGVVRNTIYRMKVKFYASGQDLQVRYYYYGTKFDASDPHTDLSQNDYTAANFYDLILEANGNATPND